MKRVGQNIESYPALVHKVSENGAATLTIFMPFGTQYHKDITKRTPDMEEFTNVWDFI